MDKKLKVKLPGIPAIVLASVISGDDYFTRKAIERADAVTKNKNGSFTYVEIAAAVEGVSVDEYKASRSRICSTDGL